MFAAVAVSILSLWVETPALDQAWNNAPARFEVADSVRTAAVFDAAGIELPCKVQQQKDKRYVYWVRTGDASATARYRIDLHAKSSFPPAVFVGAGDMLTYGRKNAITDLSAGMWSTAMPIDWDEDGDLDLLYSCTDRPQNGLYLYLQETGGVFVRSARIGTGYDYPQLVDMNGDGKLDLLTWNNWYDDIRANGLDKPVMIPFDIPMQGMSGFMLRQVDWDGDGVLDLIGGGSYVKEKHGRDERGFDDTGNWIWEAAHGYVWFYKNTGANTAPVYAAPVMLEAEDKLIDMYSRPCPMPGDFDGDGDLDLLCGEFVDEFTYFENIGTRATPILAKGRPVTTQTGLLRIDLCMMSPLAHDWDGDGRLDLIVGQEDGRVCVALNQGALLGMPHFSEFTFLKEVDAPIKSGGLVRPWLDARTGDLFCGNTAGYIERFERKGEAFDNGANLRHGNEAFRILAGYNGSPQGPSEEKWGYTVCVTGDVDNDGEDEIVLNSSFGRIEYLEFAADRDHVGPLQSVKVDWDGEAPYPSWNWWKPGADELVVQWRSRPLVRDWDKDGVNDLIVQDHEGYLAFYKGLGQRFKPGQRIFLGENGQPLRLNDLPVGKSGRTVFDFVDWDGDGDLDLLRDTESGLCIGWFENIGNTTFAWRGDFPGRGLEGHNNGLQVVDWNRDGRPDVIVGAEDGHIYAFHRAALDHPDKLDAVEVPGTVEQPKENAS